MHSGKHHLEFEKNTDGVVTLTSKSSDLSATLNKNGKLYWTNNFVTELYGDNVCHTSYDNSRSPPCNPNMDPNKLLGKQGRTWRTDDP